MVSILLVFEVAAFLWAGPAQYRLNLTIQTDKDDEYILVMEIDERQYKSIENNPHEGIQPFLTQARKEYAEKIGYRKEIYGEENYKMVVISRYSIVIRDISQERIVFKKE